MRQKAGIFCHNGLGDGICGIVLSHNLQLNGFEVDTYQNALLSMQSWFPHLPIFQYPDLNDLSRILQMYDLFFVCWNDSSDFVNRLIQEGKRRFPEKMKIIYLYPSPNIINEPYYKDCLTNPTISIAENMRNLIDKVLHLPKSTLHNGLIPPVDRIFRKYPKRIVFHPTSSRPKRCWPRDKFVKLALHLKKMGYEPVFIPGSQEADSWRSYLGEKFEVAEFSTLDQLAGFIYESGFLVGNDSGLGHLASAVGIETITICRRKALAKLWAPSLAKNIAVTPSSLIPNVRGFRLRDRHWQKFISVKKVIRAFELLCTNNP